ncbi:MAG TPA: hybrid sensor histidine kinase/response regulator [Magnetovibrio sp.]
MALFATALRTRIRGPQKLALLDKMQSSLRNLGAMLDGLLDMSRIEQHTIVPQVSDFSVQDILDEVAMSYAPLAEMKSLELTIVPSSVVARSDQALVSSIVGNFVTNAIRYTKQGRVLVGCRRHGNAVRLEVWDTGKGMTADELTHIFEPYHRLEGAHVQASDGLGLGLSIAKGLADLLDHSLAVRSAPGVGTVFSIELPKGYQTQLVKIQVEATLPYSKPFRGYTVLVVDDDETILDGMRTILTDWGCDVLVARSASDAATEARSLGDELDAVVSDYNLGGGETGIALLQGIEGALHRKVPAIIITGDTQPARRHEIEAAGYFLLTKPVAPVSLRPLLRRLLKPRQPT